MEEEREKGKRKIHTTSMRSTNMKSIVPQSIRHGIEVVCYSLGGFPFHIFLENLFDQMGLVASAGLYDKFSWRCALDKHCQLPFFFFILISVDFIRLTSSAIIILRGRDRLLRIESFFLHSGSREN